MRRVVVLGLCLLLAACGAQHATTPAPLSHDAAWLQGQLRELDTLACPAGCNAADWTALTGQLRGAIEARLAGKQVSAPPTTPAARPRLLLNPDGPYLNWYFVNPGDYNQDGLVSVSDLTPLGANLGLHWAQNLINYSYALALIDGDGNGEINISDLTPLGANLGNSITEWRLYEASDTSAYPANAGDPSTIAPVEVKQLADSASSPPAFRRQYIPALTPDPAKWYWVRGADASGEGIASIAVGGNNQPPVIGFNASGFSGAPPFSLHFDASGTTDPEGQGIEFLYIIPELGNFSDPVLDAQYETEGLFPGALFAVDEMGATARVEFTVTSSLGEKWRISHPDNAQHVLEANDRIRLEALQGGVPGVAFTTKDNGSDALLFCAAQNLSGSLWIDPFTLTTLDGELRDVDLALVDDYPALTWISTPTGSPVDTLYCARALETLGGDWQSESITAVPGLSAPAIGPVGEEILIAYRDGDAQSLQFAQGKVLDAGGWDIGSIDFNGEGGSTPTLTNISGAPSVAYRYKLDGSYRYCSSNVVAGHAVWNGPVTALSSGDGLLSTSLIRLSGDIPAFAMYNESDGFLKYVLANDLSAASFTPSVVAGTDMGDGRCLPAMALAGDRPFIAYMQPSGGQLFGAWATDQSGTSWEVQEVSSDVLPDVLPEAGEVFFHPAVVYAAADGTPRFAIFY